jgi:hypothetical protein
MVPKIIAAGQRLAASSSAVIDLDALQCWPDGVGISLRALYRFARGLPGVPPGLRPPRRDGLHVGVALADGRHATYVDGGRRSARIDRQRDEDEPVLLMSTGSMWGRFHRLLELYMAPLPPEGPLTLVVQWLEHEIEETHTELDGSAIRAAAATVTDVWPDLPPAPTADGSGRTSVQIGGASSASTFGVARRGPAESGADERD